MAIDWDRVIVETDNNGVVVSAGQVALLIGADADTVTWGNITGDITQQSDLMALVDGYASVDSPQFTGIPRTPTPPAGNNSTRIASTAFVQGEIDRKDVPNDGKTYGRKDKAWTELGALALKNTANYETDVTGKPALGTLAGKNKVTDPTDISYMRDIYVDRQNGDDDNGTGAWNAPYKTITKAVAMASNINLTSIIIAPDTYAESIEISGKNIELISMSGTTTMWPSSNDPIITASSRSCVKILGAFYLKAYNCPCIQADYGSTVIYDTANSSDELTMEAFNDVMMRADHGSVICAENDVHAINNSLSVASANRGSTIALRSVIGSTQPTSVITNVFVANGGTIMYHSVAVSQYTTLSTVTNGGIVRQS